MTARCEQVIVSATITALAIISPTFVLVAYACQGHLVTVLCEKILYILVEFLSCVNPFLAHILKMVSDFKIHIVYIRLLCDKSLINKFL